MATRVLDRRSVSCYDCGKSHQVRLIDRGVTSPNRLTVVLGGKPFSPLVGIVDEFEAFDLVCKLINRATQDQRTCPVIPRLRLSPLEG